MCEPSAVRDVPRGTTPTRQERLAAGGAVKCLREDRHLRAALSRNTQLLCFSFPLTGPDPSWHLCHQAWGAGGFAHQAFLQQRRHFLQRTWMLTLCGEGIIPRRPPPTPWLLLPAADLPFPSPPAKCVMLGPPCRLLPRTSPGPSAPRWHASALTMTSNRKSFSFSSAFQGKIIYSCVSSTLSALTLWVLTVLPRAGFWGDGIRHTTKRSQISTLRHTRQTVLGHDPWAG